MINSQKSEPAFDIDRDKSKVPSLAESQALDWEAGFRKEIAAYLPLGPFQA